MKMAPPCRTVPTTQSPWRSAFAMNCEVRLGQRNAASVRHGSTPPRTDLKLPRYKIMVQVVVGQQRGAGVRMGSRCLWDAVTDNKASETLVNVSCIRTCLVRHSAPLPTFAPSGQLVCCRHCVWGVSVLMSAASAAASANASHCTSPSSLTSTLLVRGSMPSSRGRTAPVQPVNGAVPVPTPLSGS